ncbi:MAG: hypothetical protein JSW51_08325 [Gemmatimonadota bacterium]|nr:MAG: hypothetical protein JSW51_08325 [Gemmatimonadota bacterium]
MNTPRLSKHLLYALGLAACSGAETQPATTRDSSGIEIVESWQPQWQAGDGWHLSADPILQIGTADGPQELQFHQIEGAIVLADGRVVVANAGSGEIRFFGESGGFLSSVGGLGDAPGEYRQITGIGTGPADSLWVFDYGLRRFTVLTAAGEAVRTVSVGGTLSSAGAVGRLSDGSFVVKESWSSHLHGGERQGLVRDPVAVATLAADGSGLDTITTVAGREVFVSTENGRAVMSAPLFARTSSAAMGDDAVYVGDQAKFEIRRYSPDGMLQQVVRVPDADLRLTSAAVQQLKDEILAREPEQRRAMMRQHLQEMALPPSKPAYSRLMIDGAGNIWAAEYARYPAVPLTWTVFTQAGELLGEVPVPRWFNVLQIGVDWILGVGRDELDVEYVRSYRLLK